MIKIKLNNTNLKTTIAAKRAKYNSMIHEYKRRRKKIKLDKNHVHYRKRLDRVNTKIKRWSWRVYSLGKMAQRIQDLENAVVSYTGIYIKDRIGTKVPEDVKLAKCLYYKYGLEEGIQSKNLREHIGIGKSNLNQPAYYRRTFTLSFATNEYNAQLWKSFKRFYYEHQLKGTKPKRVRRRRLGKIQSMGNTDKAIQRAS